jgi:hypothetical protein
VEEILVASEIQAILESVRMSMQLDTQQAKPGPTRRA